MDVTNGSVVEREEVPYKTRSGRDVRIPAR